MSDDSVAPPSPDDDGPARVARQRSRWWPGILAVLAIAGVTTALIMLVLRDPHTTGAHPPLRTESLVRSTAAFEIEAVFYRVKGAQMERLTHGQPVGLKDQLSLSITATAPTYLYVVNEDERDD